MTKAEVQKETVLSYCLDNNIDLTVRGNNGLHKQIVVATQLPNIDVKNSLQLIRKDLGINIREAENKRYKSIEKYFINSNLKPSSRIPKGFIHETSKLFNLDTAVIKRAIIRFKKKSKTILRSTAITPTAHIKPTGTSNPLIPMLRDMGITRANPNKEKVGCKLIIETLLKIPTGGAGMIFGTATPICAPAADVNNNMILSDNQKVAHALEFTTDVFPIIVIGDGVDKEKAELKANLWRTDNATSDYDIHVDIVNRDSALYYGMKLAEKHPFSKLVIMTSGNWEGCNDSVKKYRLDSNFKSPCEFLSVKYPNLHIIAMITGGKEGHYNFRVQYLNNGKSETIMNHTE